MGFIPPGPDRNKGNVNLSFKHRTQDLKDDIRDNSQNRATLERTAAQHMEYQERLKRMRNVRGEEQLRRGQEEESTAIREYNREHPGHNLSRKETLIRKGWPR